MFLSLVRPERISSPMTSTAALGVFGICFPASEALKRMRADALAYGDRGDRAGPMQEVLTGATRQATPSPSTGRTASPGMRRAGRLAAECLDAALRRRKARRHRPRRSTISSSTSGMDHGALPATLNYRGYRKSSCTSINHVVCHGIPNEKPLREGDIVNIDVTFVARRLARRFEPHVRRRRTEARRRAADRGHLRVPDARSRGDPPRRADGRHRPRHPDLRGGASAARSCAISAATASAAPSTSRPNVLHYGQIGEGSRDRSPA